MKNTHKRKRLFFVSSVFVISILALAFVILNFRENIVFFYSPSEIRDAKISNRQVRVGGLVKKGSVKKIDALNTEFIITDYNSELQIHYNGILHNLFREGQGVVARGVFNGAKDQFFSSELLIKHDENYMPPEVAESLKEHTSY